MIANFINAVAILIGTTLGRLLGVRLPERLVETLFQALGLGILLTGATMALQGEKIIPIIISLILGAAIGEIINLEGLLEALGRKLEKRLGSDHGDFSRAFVGASLIYCVGAMAITGALEAGLNHNYTILYVKSLLDGTLAVILTTKLGIGVGFSALSVLAYQGTLTLGATWIAPFLDPTAVKEITATGGLLIVAIALNLLKIKEFRVGNLLPAIFLVGILASLF